MILRSSGRKILLLFVSFWWDYDFTTTSSLGFQHGHPHASLLDGRLQSNMIVKTMISFRSFHDDASSLRKENTRKTALIPLATTKPFDDDERRIQIMAPPPPLSVIMLLQGGLPILLLSFLMALGLVTWETVVSEYALPSRQTRSTVVHLQQPHAGPNAQWGQVTVRGMGFGQGERELLLLQQQQEVSYDGMLFLQLPSRPSYNEVMLQHRRDRVPFWKSLRDSSSGISKSNGNSNSYASNDQWSSLSSSSSSSSFSHAIHTVLTALESIPHLQTLARNYQWEELRSTLRSNSLWQDDLNGAAAVLRQYLDTIHSNTNVVVGFDWGSCAWRSACGAWADWQESIDQIDALAGLLEPQEVLFCLDIVERSLRDVLAEAAAASSSSYAAAHSASSSHTAADAYAFLAWQPGDWDKYQKHIPEYKPYRQYAQYSSSSTFNAEDTRMQTEDEHDDEEDDPYLQALKQFKLDE